MGSQCLTNSPMDSQCPQPIGRQYPSQEAYNVLIQHWLQFVEFYLSLYTWHVGVKDN